jgi:hypothetical protein
VEMMENFSPTSISPSAVDKSRERLHQRTFSQDVSLLAVGLGDHQCRPQALSGT